MSQRAHIARILGTLLLPTALIAITGAADPSGDEERCSWDMSEKCMILRDQTGDIAAIAPDAIWHFPRNVEKQVEVCWENPSEAHSTEINAVRGYIDDTWNNASALQLVYWKQCRVIGAECDPTRKNGIGVQIHIVDNDPDVVPQANGAGTELEGMCGGVVLNFTKGAQWEKRCDRITSVPASERRAICLRALVVHEFGHVLGLEHEHMRDERKRKEPHCFIPAESELPKDIKPLTEYDPESVMNYCNRATSRGDLSQKDITAVQLLYCPKGTQCLSRSTDRAS